VARSYQKRYYVLESFEEGAQLLRSYCETLQQQQLPPELRPPLVQQ
jgi:hypothetical protein